MELTTFVFNRTDVRTILIEQEPWFVGKDVTDVLGYSNSRKAIGDHVDEEDKNTVTIRDGNRGNPNFVIINESGVYSLIFNSTLPSAKQFRHWVTYDVLPSIRRKGYYSAMTPEDTIKALAKGMTYDHFMEDVVFPAVEMQEEFTFDKLLEHYCGYPVKTMDDLRHAKAVFQETAKERKQRLSALSHNMNDYIHDDAMYRKLSRYKWTAPENRGHYQTIKGVRWFDDYILEHLN